MDGLPSSLSPRDAENDNGDIIFGIRGTKSGRVGGGAEIVYLHCIGSVGRTDGEKRSALAWDENLIVLLLLLLRISLWITFPLRLLKARENKAFLSFSGSETGGSTQPVNRGFLGALESKSHLKLLPKCKFSTLKPQEIINGHY